MLAAYISDIHGNLEALTSVLKDIAAQKADKVVCLGDVVGYGVNPNECLRLVDTECVARILGNHDEAAATGLIPNGWNPYAKKAMAQTIASLDDESRAILQSRFHKHAVMDEVLLVHGSPNDPTHEYVLPEASFSSGYMTYVLHKIPHTFCVNGHTHIPGLFDAAGYSFCKYYPEPRGQRGKTILNVGSVGQPRDKNPESCYLLMDDNSFQWRRVKYDVDAVVRKMVAAGAEHYLADRLRSGR